MSELFEKFREIKYLPLFPLPVVLLPNELLPLHIFEPRYQQMLKDIELTNNLFGLTFLSAAKSESSFPAVGSVGCIAEVRQVQPLEEGRSNIVTIGVIRYQLEELIESDTPYYYGEISVFEDFEEDEQELNSIADVIYEMFVRAARTAHRMSEVKTEFPEVPRTDPQTLSFLISAAFSLPLEMKFEFLQMRSTIDRLTKLESILKDSLDKIEEGAKINKIAKTNGHGNKKITF